MSDLRIPPDPSDGAVDSAGVRRALELSQLEYLTQIAHQHATTERRATTELIALRWQQQHDPESVRLRAELAAVSAELDRLRALPELRVGQRLRHAAVALHRSPAEPQSGPGRAQRDVADALEEGTRASGEPLPHPQLAPPSAVVTVRNRPAALRLVLDWLQQHDVHDVEIVDNASSDPMLGNSLRGLGIPVTRIPVDLGASAAWASGVIARHAAAGNVLLIDTDRRGVTLPDAACPVDVVDRMTHELNRRLDLDAVAPSPSSDVHQGGFRLLRRGVDSMQLIVGQLEPPYRSVTIAPDPDDTSERYAMLHDERGLDADA